ncbi:MAG: hypothetical protein HY301_21335 [Verrucomicrobia bacterium]|nr:hypothetical protein [Verrucomicrobiota bacterium]
MSGTSLLAHNSPNSAVMLDFQRDGVAAELILPLVELELGFKQELVGSRTQILAQHGPALKEYLLAHLNPVAPDGRRWSVEIRRLELQFKEQPFDLVARVWMRPPPGAPLRKFTFDYSVITHEVMNHAAFISVRRDWNTAVFPDRPEPAGMIQFTIMQVEIDRTHGSWWRGFGSVLKAKAGRFPWVSAALAALTLAAVGWQWMVVARIRRQAAPPQTTSASFPLRTQNHPAP